MGIDEMTRLQERMANNQIKIRKAVFLDRDGVISRAIVRDGLPFAPGDIADFEILPEAPEACRRLKQAGFLLIVATNQPDVGRGTMKQEVVEAMHAKMQASVPID